MIEPSRKRPLWHYDTDHTRIDDDFVRNAPLSEISDVDRWETHGEVSVVH